MWTNSNKMSLTVVLLSIPIVTLALIYFYSKRKFNYWKNKNVPHLKPALIFGNYGDYIRMKSYTGHVVRKICQEFPDAPYVGAYFGTEPVVIIQSPELIKQVMTKDFYYFNSREIADYTHHEVFTSNIFFTFGDRWKVLRQNLTPLFSSAKMRNMFHLIESCSHVFEDLLDNEANTSQAVEVRSLMARYTMDCIGACAFGIDTNVMTKVDNNPFRRMGDLIFEISNSRGLSLVTRAIWPSIFYGLRFKLFPDDLFNFFHKLLTDVFKSRKYEPSSRNDFIDLMMSLKNAAHITGDSITNLKAGEGKKITLKVDDVLVVGQSLSFFAAGYETSATTSSYTLYELAKNQEAQRRAIEEVDAYLQKQENKLDYNCVTELPYLEACVDEALRLYPVLGTLTREVVEDYTLPDGVKLQKNMRVHLPMFHIQRDEKHFPEPQKFRPERFLGDAKKDIKPYTYFPFGEGPRVCMGMRFAKMQILSGLVTLFKKYRVELADGMPQELQFEPRGFVTQPIGGIQLKLVTRDGWEKRVLVRQGS